MKVFHFKNGEVFDFETVTMEVILKVLPKYEEIVKTFKQTMEKTKGGVIPDEETLGFLLKANPSVYVLAREVFNELKPPFEFKSLPAKESMRLATELFVFFSTILLGKDETKPSETFTDSGEH